MKYSRRHVLKVSGATAVVSSLPRSALAMDYPTRPVHFVNGSGPGGAPDIGARLIGQALSERLGQPFVVENKPGVGMSIAAETVVRSAGDGYTLLLVTGANSISATLYRNLSFDLNQDIAPVGSIWRVPQVMEVTPSFPAKTVPEFIAYAKANPGKVNMASSGNGTTPHVAGELFKMMTGVDILHVPYGGTAPALTGLMSGEVQVMFDVMPSSIEYIKAGKLRALAVTTPARWDGLPDVPTVSEFVPGYEATSWIGIGAPKNTPDDIVEKLNRELNAILADPKMISKLANLGSTAYAQSPGDFGKFVSDETRKWGEVVKFSGAKPD